MARKKKPEEHENHERWLVSYADFITLLFAFFVVMYSVSSVNEGKYRVLSNSLTTAFGKSAASISPIVLGSTSPKTSLVEPAMKSSAMFSSMSISNPIPGVDSQSLEDSEAQAEARAMDELADELGESMKSLVDDKLVKVGKGQNGIEVEINTSVLFPSGSAYLHAAAKTALKKVAGILKEKGYRINVEGFTDNVPINTDIYPSNWELSAGRAASVVHLFTRYGIDPKNMSAIGYGEYKPVASNTTEKGRKENRRVVIVIAPKLKKRKVEDDLEKIKNRNIRSIGKKKGGPG